MTSDWQRSLVTLAAVAVAVVIVGALYWAKSIFIPVALAIFLAFVLYPPVMWLHRHGLGRTPAVVVLVAGVLLVAVGIGFGVSHQLVTLAETLPDRKEAIEAKVAAAKHWVVGNGDNRFGQFVDDIVQIIQPRKKEAQPVVVEAASPGLASKWDTYLGPVAEFLGQAAFTFILTVFMLIRREDLRNRMIWFLGDGKVTTTTRAVDDASHRISRYLLMQLMINSSFGLIISFGLFVLGVTNALLWGFIAAIMRYVPYIGTWIGLIPPVLFSFATAPAWGGGWGQPISVFVLFIGLELLCNNIFEPWLYGSSMGLSEVAQLVAAGFWAFLWGPIGLILSGPLTACLLVLGKHVRRLEFLGVLLGDTPALEPRVAFYQRLAARDQDEASDVALDVAKRDGIDAALETVVIPALYLARRDLDEGDLEQANFRVAIRDAREVAEELASLREQTAEVTEEERVRVLVVPSRDDAEQLAAEILAAMLEPSRWDVRVAGDETLASELVGQVEDFRPAIVVLVALPPGGLSHCRYLVSRVRAKCPDVRLVVGRWGSPAPAEGETLPSIKGADGVDHTLADSRKRLTELHSVLMSEIAKQEKSSTKRQPVGTAGA